MFKTIAIVVAVLLVVGVAAVLLLAATKPDTFRVERAASIKASPEKIFPLLNDFRGYVAWSPYEKLDPEMKRTYSGASSGKGSVYSWESSGKAGVGRMEIADTSPPSKVRINLDFVKPFETSNVVEFTLEPKGESTNVTWAMQGSCPFFAKVMQVFFSMDSMVGKDFENGLANLKALAER
jgi:carbon monoxide dehydrogenase subunit G